MIDDKQRENLKPILGNRYTSSVLKILREYEIKKENGEEYKAAFVRHVFNGLYENQGIEMAIYEDFDRKKKIKNKNKRKAKALTNKKPEATTPGSN